MGRTSLIIFLLVIVSCGLFAAKDSSQVTVTRKTYTIGGVATAFTVETGYLDWKDDNNDVKAKVFYTAYTRDGASDKERPITFAFNGGPGSSSLWLHLGCMGPRRIEMDNAGNAPAPPYTLVDNASSWLDLTDIVFIDPVGTGFSRPAKDVKSDQFYGYKNDISSVGEFVRLYLNKSKRWASPKYLAGESYGTTRAAGLSNYLIDKHAIYLNGIILISAALDFATFREYKDNDLAHLSYFTAYTATAFYHKKLQPQYLENLQATLAKAEMFVENEYAPALFRGNGLSAKEKEALAQKLSDFSGIRQDVWLKNNLRIPTYRFRKMLINDSSVSVGRFDSRLIINEPDPSEDQCEYDASFTKIRAAFSTCINQYIRNDLNYSNDLPYNVIGNVSPWEYGNGKYLNVMNELEEALTQNPDMKVWVASGIYDIATPYYAAKYSFRHLNVPTSQIQGVSFTYYEAGHMMYLLYPCLVQLKKDAASFYKSSKPQTTK